MKVSQLAKASFLLAVILSVGFLFINPAVGDSWTIDRLTDDVREEHAPVWSPDGSKIAYVSCPEGEYIGELHVLDLAAGSVDIIYDYVSWSRGLHWVGDYIAFLKREEPYVPGAGDNDVWKIKEDGTGLQQITFTETNGIDRGNDGVGTTGVFALSPDGSKLAFVANHGNGWYDPYVCNADGSDGYVLLQNLPHCFYIKWNADGSKVYYAGGGDHHLPQTMYRSNPDGSGDETITGGLPQMTDFSFSPDGSTVGVITGIFHRPCKSCPVDQIDRNLTVMNPDGTGKTDLLNDSFDDTFGHVCTLTHYDPPYAYRPSFHAWGSDNETVVFTSDRSGNFDIWTIKKDGTNLTQITVDTARDYDAGFSPDGTKIVFISERDGQRDLYLMDAEAAECCPGTDGSLGDGLVAYYSFEGNADDVSGNGNHGVENGGPSYVGGVCGEAISLDGMDDYVIVEENKAPPMSPAGTVSGWLKIPSTFPFPEQGAGFVNKMLHSTGQYLYDLMIGHDGPCAAGIGISGKYVHWSDDVDERRANEDWLFDDTWHHLAYTWDSEELILYVDGAFQNSTTHSVNVYANDPMQWDLNIGRRPYASATNWKYLEASIDEVRIYDRALSAAEIAELAGAQQAEQQTYHVDGASGNDTNDGLTRETGFATIQKGIDTAEDGDSVLVWPGVYAEEVRFKGKAITVRSAGDAATIENPGDFAVSFYYGEGPGSVLKNFVIANSLTGIFIAGSAPTISNVTVVNNIFGIEAYAGSEPDISNAILWDNIESDVYGCETAYSWIGEEIEHESIEGLVAYWSFDNPSDAGHDDSGNGNDGSPVGGVTSTTGVLGGAVHLDGSGYINVPDSPSLDLPGGRGTLSAFIKVDPSSGGFGIIAKESSSSFASTIAYELLVRPEVSGIMVEHIVISDGTTVNQEYNGSGADLKDCLWHHVAATWSGPGGELLMYRDGVQVFQADQTISTINNISEPVCIGAFRWNVPPGILRKMTGDIDEVRIYNRALSQEEIQQLYQNQPSGGPMFGDAYSGDYHLKSERGRYWPEHDVWVLDDVSSPCLDAGDPEADYSAEREPNGGRINMGAFGGTYYASMTEWLICGDVNGDGVTNMVDFSIMADNWLGMFGGLKRAPAASPWGR
ncbi:MAG: PD40 domain-containing protein [Phycisphaerae bacterium]|nr:PD40 domain-containing protein [Phycisphaerae bacterium]